MKMYVKAKSMLHGKLYMRRGTLAHHGEVNRQFTIMDRDGPPLVANHGFDSSITYDHYNHVKVKFIA